jgi:hypothetical protein
MESHNPSGSVHRYAAKLSIALLLTQFAIRLATRLRTSSLTLQLRNQEVSAFVTVQH